ncbi:hypothetical protein LTR17_023095 [Elasticomyces elasticus]|nr:hypothetical protein LTR17_023095 [Elasticomyces elasticus]
MVLLQLPLPDILLAQRVDRTWCTIIRESPQLQRALFLKPANNKSLLFPGTVSWIRPCSGAHKCVRHLEQVDLRKHGGFDFRVTDTQQVYCPAINPFTVKLWPKQIRVLAYLLLRPGPTTYDRDDSRNAAIARPEASWRKMLFTQPPVVNVVADHGKARHWHEILSTSAAGVTLDDIEKSGEAFNVNVGGTFNIAGKFKLESGPTEEAMAEIAVKVLDNFRVSVAK